MTYPFYPGCSLESTARDYRDSALAVCRALGIELRIRPDWTCCGSTAAHQSDPLLALALPARNLVGAPTTVVCCAACYSRLKTANHHLAADPTIRRRVAEAIGAELITWLVEDRFPLRLPVRPLSGRGGLIPLDS